MPTQEELQLTLTISQIETAVAMIEKKLATIHPTYANSSVGEPSLSS
jgi:hypothetical protein